MFGVKRTYIITVEEENSVDTSKSDLESYKNNQFQNDAGHTIEIENILPMRFSCFAHTPNLCVTADMNKVKKTLLNCH